MPRSATTTNTHCIGRVCMHGIPGMRVYAARINCTAQSRDEQRLELLVRHIGPECVLLVRR